MAPYQFKKELGVKSRALDLKSRKKEQWQGYPCWIYRPLNPREKERLHGFHDNHTEGFTEQQRHCFQGNTFHTVAVAYLLSSWAVSKGYMKRVPRVEWLWKQAGYFNQDAEIIEKRKLDEEEEVEYFRRKATSKEKGERVTVVTEPAPQDDDKGDYVMHLVQDEATIAELLDCEVPPPEYYDRMLEKWRKWWPKTDPFLLEHMISVMEMFDTATVFALSFGIAKFALAQLEAKLVGEIVGRDGRRPNPAIVKAIKAWPPIYTLRQLQHGHLPAKTATAHQQLLSILGQTFIKLN